MKYCCTYKKTSKADYTKKFDEITIPFNPSDTSLLTFLLSRLDQEFNIFIADNQDFLNNKRIKFFKSLKKDYPEINFKMKLTNYKNPLTKEVFELLRDAGIPYFFSAAVSDWDTFNGYIDLKPTDIYISEELGFYSKQCAEVAHKSNIRLRAIPNIIQSSWKESSAIKSFFIRPEDVKYFEEYIDVLEFFDDYQADNYYHIYAESGFWLKDLKPLIIGLEENISNQGIPTSTFASRRTHCGKRCNKGGKCNFCEIAKNLANSLADKELYLKNEENLVSLIEENDNIGEEEI